MGQNTHQRTNRLTREDLSRISALALPGKAILTAILLASYCLKHNLQSRPKTKKG